MKKLLATICVLGPLLEAYSAGITPPVALPTAATLPKGVRNVTYKGVIGQGTEKFSNTGVTVPLADPFFQELTVEDMLFDQPKDKIAGTEFITEESGMSSTDSIGTVTGAVNVKAFVQVPIVAYGITNDLTAAVAVPVKRTSINIDTGMIQNPNAVKVLNNLNVSAKDREEARRKLANPVYYKLQDEGYKPLENEEKTQLGDIKLVSKYRFLNTKNNAIAVSGALTLPTGEEADPDKLVDVEGGDGQTDIGVGVSHDFKFLDYFTLSSSLEYTVQVKDTVTRRVPKRSKSTVSNEKDENISRDLGDLFSGTVAIKGKYEGFNLGIGYNLQYKQGDTYEGTKYQSDRYQWLAKDTIQNMHTLFINVGFDTISLFKAKRFPAPMAIGYNAAVVMSGKNVTKDTTHILDFSLFF